MSCAERRFQELLRVAQVGEGLPGADVEGGFARLDYDLSAAGPVPYHFGKAYGLWVPVVGNPTGARVVADFEGGGIVTLSPGCLLRLPFDRLNLSRLAGSLATGTLQLQVFRTPRASFEAVGGAELAGNGSPMVLSTSQNYNQTNNTPLAATDGLPLAGAKGLRVTIDAGVGNTFNTGAGSLVLWYYNETLAAWAEGRTAIAIPNNGLRRVTFDDVPIYLGAGRVAEELRSVTHSGGAGAITSVLEVL